MSTNKIDNRVIGALMLLALLALIAKPVWEARDQWQFGAGRDDGVYLVTAKSLASGEGYRQENLPGRPYLTKYPPLFPLFLSIAWRVTPQFPRVLTTASMLQACLLPIYLALMLAVLRQLGLSWRRTVLVGALACVSFGFVLLAITLYSELLFGCFLLGAIWTLERSALLNSGRWALAGGLITALAYLTRSAALPMFLAVPVFFVLKKRWRLSGFFFSSALPIAAAWHLWMAAHASATLNTPYLDEYLRVIRETGLGSHLLNQLGILSGSVAEALWPGILEFLSGIPLHHLVLVAAVSGAIRMGRRRGWPLYAIFTALYLVMITCWWFQGLSRMIVPVWPMLLVGIAEEASHFASLAAHSVKFKSAPRWALVALAVFLVIRNDRVTWQKSATVSAAERDQRTIDRRAYTWIAGHAGPDSLILAWKDTAAYLYTGVPSSHDLFVATIPESEEFVGLRPKFVLPQGAYSTAYLILLASDLTGNQLESFRARAAARPGSKLAFASPGAYVYQIPL